MSASSSPGFGIYIHWPFCAQKCPYCDFNSHVRHKGWDEQRFLSAYLTELETMAARAGRETVTSVFFGGGTPSLMNPATTEAVLDKIASLWPLDPNIEITLEANPGSVEAQRFKDYRNAGVNRVSVGVQSLNDTELKKLGRIHTAAEARTALAIANRTFDRFSFDLIYARPGQQADVWKNELTEALSIAGNHLSLYQLTIEPDTPYALLAKAGKLIIPDDDTALELYQLTQDMTQAAGYSTYEISNHARPGQESRHNLTYWRYGSYIGVGPGAHGRIRTTGTRIATVMQSHPETWCENVERHGHGLVSEASLDPRQQADEMLLMGLRLAEGICLDELERVGDVRISPETISGLDELGLIEYVATEPAAPGSSRLRATAKGRFVLNAIVSEIARSFVSDAVH